MESYSRETKGTRKERDSKGLGVKSEREERIVLEKERELV